jgi:hypothetical protein
MGHNIPDDFSKDLENDLVEMMFRNRNRHLSGEPGKLSPSRMREDEHIVRCKKS